MEPFRGSWELGIGFLSRTRKEHAGATAAANVGGSGVWDGKCGLRSGEKKVEKVEKVEKVRMKTAGRREPELFVCGVNC